MIKTAGVYVAAAAAEIAGCFGFWAWLRLGKSAWLLPLSMVSLATFAWLLTLVESSAAGRAYAAYGGVTSQRRWCGFGRWKASNPTAGT